MLDHPLEVLEDDEPEHGHQREEPHRRPRIRAIEDSLGTLANSPATISTSPQAMNSGSSSR